MLKRTQPKTLICLFSPNHQRRKSNLLLYFPISIEPKWGVGMLSLLSVGSVAQKWLNTQTREKGRLI